MPRLSLSLQSLAAAAYNVLHPEGRHAHLAQSIRHHYLLDGSPLFSLVQLYPPALEAVTLAQSLLLEPPFASLFIPITVLVGMARESAESACAPHRTQGRISTSSPTSGRARRAPGVGQRRRGGSRGSVSFSSATCDVGACLYSAMLLSARVDEAWSAAGARRLAVSEGSSKHRTASATLEGYCDGHGPERRGGVGLAVQIARPMSTIIVSREKTTKTRGANRIAKGLALFVLAPLSARRAVRSCKIACTEAPWRHGWRRCGVGWCRGGHAFPPHEMQDKSSSAAGASTVRAGLTCTHQKHEESKAVSPSSGGFAASTRDHPQCAPRTCAQYDGSQSADSAASWLRVSVCRGTSDAYRRCGGGIQREDCLATHRRAESSPRASIRMHHHPSPSSLLSPWLASMPNLLATEKNMLNVLTRIYCAALLLNVSDRTNNIHKRLHGSGRQQGTTSLSKTRRPTSSPVRGATSGRSAAACLDGAYFYANRERSVVMTGKEATPTSVLGPKEKPQGAAAWSTEQAGLALEPEAEQNAVEAARKDEHPNAQDTIAALE
ncbi:hypothetical protein MSAN_01598000 [Mycena sanguinolenta]|uniref:Uncharacterized protein n=1 Tax=Mycena sanguinolenta TaxID=230812 RepID=A0A8H7CV56_9AGAR|nr:hypothetical protein MSAN_01598000 [Mycena sanguinolenta]